MAVAATNGLAAGAMVMQALWAMAIGATMAATGMTGAVDAVMVAKDATMVHATMPVLYHNL